MGAVGNTRTRTRARPVWSVVVVWNRPSVSGVTPGSVVMKRKSPLSTSKRTPRAASGIPPWESVTVTSPSPPEQSTAGPVHPVSVDVRVISMLLFTVPGLTVSVALTGAAVPVSRTVNVTVVSAVTGFGISVTERPVTPPLIATMAWLLEETM